MKIAFQVDKIENLNVKRDSSVAIANELIDLRFKYLEGQKFTMKMCKLKLNLKSKEQAILYSKQRTKIC